MKTKYWITLSIISTIINIICLLSLLGLMLVCDAHEIKLNYWFLSIIFSFGCLGCAIIMGFVSELRYDAIDDLETAIKEYETAKEEMETARDKYTELLTK